MNKDYFVIIAPGENWQRVFLVLDAPSPREAEQAMWTERGYNSGDVVRVRTAANRELAAGSACEVITYDAKLVNEWRSVVQYND